MAEFHHLNKEFYLLVFRSRGARSRPQAVSASLITVIAAVLDVQPWWTDQLDAAYRPDTGFSSLDTAVPCCTSLPRSTI